MEIPPPEQRLCRTHGRPIAPSDWKGGHRNTKCSKCKKESRQSPAVKQRRALKWEKEFIPCNKHSDRRCQKSPYVNNAKRKCSSCGNKLKEGIYRSALKRALSKKNYKRSIELRKHLRGNLRGLKLFERSTGFNLELIGFTRKEINENN